MELEAFAKRQHSHMHDNRECSGTFQKVLPEAVSAEYRGVFHSSD